MHSENRPPLWLSLVIAGACVVALADWPYGYYQLLRLAVTGYAGWIAWIMLEDRRQAFAWLFGLLAVLYNPIVKIPLDRETWTVVNLATALIVMIELMRSIRTKGSSAPADAE